MFKNLSAEILGISGRTSELIEPALSHGFKGFDLDLIDFASQIEAQGLDKAARLIKSARLKIGYFRLPVRWHDDEHYRDDLARLASLAGIAAELGCSRAVTRVQPGDDARPYHENFEFHRRRLAEMAGVLADANIRLGLEFLAPLDCRRGLAFQFIQTADELLLLLRNINATNIGLALDTWHWQVGGGKLDQLATLGADKVVGVWLADGTSPVTAADAELASRRLPSDSGIVDNAAVLSILAQWRFDGPVTPAPDRSEFVGLSRDAIIKQAGAAMDRVWKAAGIGPTGKAAVVART
jgi:sugar phosphate isomerase/epimerase